MDDIMDTKQILTFLAFCGLEETAGVSVNVLDKSRCRMTLASTSCQGLKESVWSITSRSLCGSLTVISASTCNDASHRWHWREFS